MCEENHLTDALRCLPIPEVSADFDARILAALRVSIPWWQRLWQPARPLLLGTSCSFALMLVLLHWTLTAPLTSPAASLSGTSGLTGTLAARPTPSLDALLDRPNLTAGSLAAAWNNPPDPAPPVSRRPEPRRRRAQLHCPVCLVA